MNYRALSRAQMCDVLTEIFDGWHTKAKDKVDAAEVELLAYLMYLDMAGIDSATYEYHPDTDPFRPKELRK